MESRAFDGMMMVLHLEDSVTVGREIVRKTIEDYDKKTKAGSRITKADVDKMRTASVLAALVTELESYRNLAETRMWVGLSS